MLPTVYASHATHGVCLPATNGVCLSCYPGCTCLPCYPGCTCLPCYPGYAPLYPPWCICPYTTPGTPYLHTVRHAKRAARPHVGKEGGPGLKVGERPGWEPLPSSWWLFLLLLLGGMRRVTPLFPVTTNIRLDRRRVNPTVYP